MEQQQQEEGGAETPATIDQLHHQIDSIVLSIFEAMRSTDVNAAADTRTVLGESMRKASESVGRLNGINRTKGEQESEIVAASKEVSEVRERVLKLEADLIRMNETADELLGQV
jgi:hypothetical protein